jgi:hypothetical protein
MGEWRPSEISYLEPCKVICELCGQLVPARFWSEETAGAQRVFCNPDHARKYESYWLPLYGQDAVSA